MALNTVTLNYNLTDLIQGTEYIVISIAPNNYLTDTNDHLVIAPVAKQYVSRTGVGTIPNIVATDNASLTPAGWAYNVTGSGPTGVVYFNFSTFINFASGSTQNLDQLIPLSSVPTLKAFTPPGRPATLIVAAANSSAAWRNAADFIATGSHDELTINAAMAALPLQGGTIMLSDGTFTKSGDLVTTVNNTRLLGQGPNATLIQNAVGVNSNGYRFDRTITPTSLIFCGLEGMTFNGQYNAGTGNTAGYGCFINYNLTNTFWDFYLRDVWFDNWPQDGFQSTGGHGYVLDHVLGEFCGGNGCNFLGGFIDSPPRIINGTYKSNGLAGITVATIDAVVNSNEISVNAGPYGLILGASGIKAALNQIRANSQSGMHMTGGAEGQQAIGNSIESNGQHGLVLDNANCTVDANFFTGSGTTTVNTYDEIHVLRGTFNASGNFLTGNVIDGASQSRYGINLSDSSCTSTVLTSNRIINEATAPTNTLSDTIILASGNFTIGPAFLCPPSVYAPASQTTKGVSTTTMAAFFSTSINTGNFVAPSSGVVLVSLRCTMASAIGTFMSIGLAAHGTVTPLVCNSHEFEFWTSDGIPVAVDFYVSGLTPGTTYNFDLLGATSVGAANIYAFGENSTTPTLAAGGLGSPVIITVLGQ